MYLPSKALFEVFVEIDMSDMEKINGLKCHYNLQKKRKHKHTDREADM